MSQVIPATDIYRQKVAAAAASGGTLPSITHVAWGTGSTPAAISDTSLEAEVSRSTPSSTIADGVLLVASGQVTGDDVSGYTLREVGIFDSDGDLAGRRVFSSVELDAGTTMKITLELQF